MLAESLIDNLGHVTVKALAVAGGAAVVAFLTGILASLIVRQLFRKSLPPAPRTLLRVLGGVAGGLGVAALLFSGLGGGWGLGGDPGAGPSRGNLTPATRPEPIATSEPTPRRTGPPTESVRVVMLGGGMVRNAAAYRIDGEQQARPLADLQQELRKRTAGDTPVKSIEIVVYDNSVARGSAPVADLERWAQQNNLAVSVVATPGDIPP
jgi:hypothetical protein